MLLERIFITNLYKAILADPKKRLSIVSNQDNQLLVKDNESNKLYEIEINYKKGEN